ncbi:MAG: ribosomal-processing cysteine protease Prp [Culicoidibacterales bacterium]
MTQLKHSHMVQAVFYSDKNHNYIGARIEGHALFSDSGTDIVCAGISASTFGSFNSLLLHLEIEDATSVVTIDNENAIMEINTSEYTQFNITNIIYETLYITLKGIADEYPDSLTIYFK